jgi:hypothetical protein
MNRIIYNLQSLYLAPYSGEQGYNSNEGNFYLSGCSILKKLEKIQNFNYSIQPNRVDIPISKIKKIYGTSNPQINFNFSYIPDGITNEYRLNFDPGHFKNSKLIPMFSSMLKSNLIDKKNFFLTINKNEDDLFKYSEPSQLSINPTGKYDILNSDSVNYGVLFFQNCYLTEYSVNIKVGNIPIVNQAYTCDNITFYNSGLGLKFNILDLKSGINISQNEEIIIPKNLNLNNSDIGGKNLLLSTDANIQINKQNNENILFDKDVIYGLDYSIKFNRSEIKSLNYKLPLNKKINFPVMGSLNFNILEREIKSGSAFYDLNKNENYNIICNFPNTKSGLYPTQFIFSGCKFNQIEYNSNIGQNKLISLSFDFDIDPDFYTRGLFASGNLLYIKYEGLLIGSSGAYDYNLLGSSSLIEYDLGWTTSAPLIY